jgi:phospholipase C
MLENRSFDHMLGWSGLTGVDAVTGEPTAVEGLTGSEWNELRNAERVPVSAGSEYVLPIDPGHGFDDVLEQLCGPGAVYPDPRGGGYPPITNAGFASRLAGQVAKGKVKVSPAAVMNGFTPDQLPVLHSLAREFAVCDHWFSSMPGPTWPNRFFVHAASSGGLDDSPSPLRTGTAILEGYRFSNGTLFDRLDKAGRRWRIVEGDALPCALGISGMIEHALGGRFIGMDELRRRLARPVLQESYIFIEPHYGHVLTDGSNFKCGNSQHPLDDVTRGERLLKEVYEAIRNSPHWPRSMLVVLYDEHGGFYDHVVPPPAVPPGDTIPAGVSQNQFAFDRLGVRVPAVVISPFIRRGLIDHTVYDHSSLLATIEHFYGLAPLTNRDAAAARFDHLLELASPRLDAPTALPQPAVSGVPDCEDSLLQRIAGELEEMPEELAEAPEAVLTGFVHIAFAREIHLAATMTGDVEHAIEREKDRLLSTYERIRTKFDAARFLHDVERRYRSMLSEDPAARRSSQWVQPESTNSTKNDQGE